MIIEQELHFENIDPYPFKNPKNGGADREWPSFIENSIFESVTSELSYSLGLPEAMVRLALLSVMATSCQHLYDVAPPSGKGLMPLSLFIMIAAESGTGKSLLSSHVHKPIKIFEKEKRKELEPLISKAKREHKVWSIKYKALEKNLMKAVAKNEDEILIMELESKVTNILEQEPKIPKEPRSFYENSTSPALIKNLIENFRCALLSSSEAGSILNGETFRDSPLFNKLYSAEAATLDRSSYGNIILENPRLSICLMLQRVAINRFLEKSGKFAHENGFLPRFIFYALDINHYRDQNDGPAMSIETESRYHSRVIELLSKSIEHDECNSKYVLQFSSKAKILWKKIFISIKNEMKKGGVYAHSKEHASKLLENITRVASIIHAFEGYKGDISHQTLSFAYRFCQKCSYHFINHLADEPEIVKLTNLLVRDIRKIATPTFDGYRFHKFEIQRRGHPSLRKIENRALALDMLEKLGHLRIPSNTNAMYEFKNTVWTTIDPEQKNGEDLTFSELPLWSDQALENYDSRGRYSEIVDRSENSRHY